MDDITRVLMAARRYGIRVYVTPEGARHEEKAGRTRRGLPVVTSWGVSHAARGPLGHACSTTKRILYFDHLDPSRPEQHLHELCHVLLTPPGVDIDDFPEDALLLPFERVLAKDILSRAGYRRVLSFQNITQVEWWDAEKDITYEYLSDVYRPHQHPIWRNTLKTLETIGMLDQGEVTWNLPKWNKLPKELLTDLLA